MPPPLPEPSIAIGDGNSLTAQKHPLGMPLRLRDWAVKLPTITAGLCVPDPGSQ